ncbi:uncharacterized protein CcaverHIS019_0409430 [Cutaneotrichosporon cavernicola]|uniref:Streptomycin biosynthesis protein StrI n=1 Tax=Cutaneotrichosporon cavernicola TaxID=279322 RepID=A0AA48L556_9TREE|nr:uncharacterized protein CcaverHIS019_0409430 [Cutaneotrichosporon cavernicola]BEI92123.1 hypothetical protein CcaverHIS019_0409430 [Cutaneotrichosporon cavernicola]BEI99893.1 hypothetical protein CcaverHIS631_0409360 [Cutaneotrichosporon cavernicola]BEJ07668.1 hypothetical protein CcaverHIS641_0409370 [Cutaneotrichosporon cavernicola]
MTADTPQPISIIVLGGGQRGVIYSKYCTQGGRATIAAVADPRDGRRKLFARQFHVPQDKLFSDWREVAKLPKFADAVVVSVLDQLHAEVVHVFAKLGYHILCEKPMATEIADCVAMVRDITPSTIFGVGHVLRYSPYNVAVKKVIDSGILGEIVNIQHQEPVGNVHFSHSFVRGNWNTEETTTFALMSKCCHDLDILSFYLSGAKPVRVSSFGNLFNFKPSKKPTKAGDATRCLECPAEPECVWSAKRIYYDPVEKQGKKGWASVFVDDVTPENVKAALKDGPYGRCVFEAGNDVVDHQVVNIEYEGGTTANMTMSAFTESECNRQTYIQGTLGELVGDMRTFTVFDFRTRQRTSHSPKQTEEGGHGGGDAGLSMAFVDAVVQRKQECLGITPDDVLNSHLIVFAAEKARHTNTVVDFDTFKTQALDGTATYK